MRTGNIYSIIALVSTGVILSIVFVYTLINYYREKKISGTKVTAAPIISPVIIEEIKSYETVLPEPIAHLRETFAGHEYKPGAITGERITREYTVAGTYNVKSKPRYQVVRPSGELADIR